MIFNDSLNQQLHFEGKFLQTAIVVGVWNIASDEVLRSLF